MQIFNISSNFENFKRYLKKRRNKQNNGKNTKKMKTVTLGGGGSGGGTTKHEASPALLMDLESGKSHSSRRLRAFPMASSRTGTLEIVDGNFVVEIYKRMVTSDDPSLSSSHL